MLTRGVVTPVGIEVTVVDQRAEPEYGFGTCEAPPGAGDVQAIADQVSAGALDRAGGDGPARSQGDAVAKLVEVAGQGSIARAWTRQPPWTRAVFTVVTSARPNTSSPSPG